MRIVLAVVSSVAALLFISATAAADTLIPVGVARIDISPRGAVPLMGYAARAKLGATAEIAQPIHARALAFGPDQDLAILLTIDNCILPGKITEEVRRRLKEKRQVPVEGVVLTVTHTHSAPCLSGAAPNIFATDFSADDQKAIDAYTAFFADQLERVAEQAVADRKPAKVAWGKGRAGFAKNRRTAGGPVEHEMPMLRVLGPDDSLRAVFVSYACHCTTLGGEFNAVHGDWAGAASAAIERAHPGAIGLIAIGCGADANPDPRGSVELATRHGEEIAREVDRLLSTTLSPLNGIPLCRLESLQLPFQPHFSRAQWEERAAAPGIVGYHARKWLARIDRGEQPPQAIPYPVQTWTFGKDLAMIFLGGEVVVDYALRLARELDPKRIWTVAYANDVPCYIPSKRILAEGGYEAESSLWYYDRPQRLAPESEDLIVGAARKLLGNGFTTNSSRAEMPPPRSVEEARAAFQLRKEFTIQAAAFEPLVQSPVAIDFAADGRLWVCEMRDYPQGIDGKGKPGGCVKLLRDENGDGIYDTAEVWADDLPFPTGIMEWGDGVLVCAAPDIWHLSRAAGSHDPAIKRVRLLSGFATDNFQARVSGLRLGLDGWVHGSGGLFGGKIVSHKTGKTHDCSNRDFRFRPETGEFEALAGVSQQGHVRDDFDQWFGNDNSNLLWHFPLPDHYRKRNPHFVAAPMRVAKSRDADPSRVFPMSAPLERFNDPHDANRLTSASGPEIFREQSFGPAFAGNAFVCEPVHNLVRRAILSSEAGATFATGRADGEQTSEFLASSDNWFRPVEARTGPDGALWIVDMYRFVIEHPRWIPEERLKQLDVRAGAERGRIWRVMPANAKWERPPDLRRRSSAELANEIGLANGVRRDQAHRILLERSLNDSRKEAAPVLARIAAEATRPEKRAHALALLSGLEALDEATLLAALKDPDARLRRYAVSLCEPYLRDKLPRRDELLPKRLGGSDGRAPAPNRPNGERVLQALRPLLADPDAAVRYQLALSLGESRTPLAAELLASSALHDRASEWHRAAVLSSALAAPDKLAREILAADIEDEPFTTLRGSLITTFVASGATGAVAEWIAKRFPVDAPGLSPAKLPEAFRFLAALGQNPALRSTLTTDPASITARALSRLQNELATAAPRSFADTSASDGTRAAALEFLAERARHSSQERSELLQVVDVELPTNLRRAWLEAVRKQTAPEVAPTLLATWPRRSPAERSELTALLLSRDAWIGALLDATERGEITPAEFAPLQRQQLREHTNRAVRERATKLFPRTESQRAGIVAQFSAVDALRSNHERGQAVFDRACATCHRFGNRGHVVGPELELSRAKPLSDLLLAIFDPNAAIEPRYAAWHAQLKDGRSATGVVRDESSASLRMVQPGGTSEVIRRSDIAQLQPLANSLMPEGLEQLLSKQDVADLIGWLRASEH